MAKRFVSIWFPHLITDREIRRQPELRQVPFVFATPERGRMIVKAASHIARVNGIHSGMAVADCRAILPGLQVFDNIPGVAGQLLHALAEWCIRFTPAPAVDMPDGLILDVSGCTHLWGGEDAYLKDITTKLQGYGYHVRSAMADTIGTAWAISRFGGSNPVVQSGGQVEALLPLPPAALRLEPAILERLQKLGLHQVRSFISMPRSSLRRRFGQTLLSRLDQAIGQEIEVLQPVRPVEPYQERLPCMEPIRTATGIEIALQRLLEKLCERLTTEDKGLRRCICTCYRIDGNIRQIEIGTNRPSRNVNHLFRLFENKIRQIEPGLGIELFVLEAPVVEDLSGTQDVLWNAAGHNDDIAIAELLDRIAGKAGMNVIHRYLPAEHYWPERSYKLATSLHEQPAIPWREDLPRPIHILPDPEPIEVTVPLPDYPPMLFIHQGKLHNIRKADGPERIEQEWWLQKGLYRDYYCVEDEDGARYWIFRSGDYNSGDPKWYIHGYFA